ncbi:MAG TPA: GGDEF domain-containing protein [Solimonas sp.]|nr:GGDEF domain-containing protein [Solimonas sp.]
MESLSEIEKAKGQRRFWQAFAPPLEDAFRRSQRWRYRYSRAALFLLGAFGFANAALFQDRLLTPAPEFLSQLRQIALSVVALCLLAGAATLVPSVPHRLRKALQSLGVIWFAGGTLLLRYHALRGELVYPHEMLGIVIVAVAIFGGFSSRRVMWLGAILLGTSVALELGFSNMPTPELNAKSLSYMAFIAIFGSLTQEWLARAAWINHRYATALLCTDQLTGLTSRGEFSRQYLRLLGMGRREHKPVGVVFVDIDHFKRINDRHGHLFGDDVIRIVGQALASNFARRPWDLCARFGGEEFVLARYDVSPESMPQMVLQLLEAVRNLRLAAPDGGPDVSLTASVGAVWLVPVGETADQVLNAADTLLYRAKEGGRNRGFLARYGDGDNAVEVL